MATLQVVQQVSIGEQLMQLTGSGCTKVRVRVAGPPEDVFQAFAVVSVHEDSKIAASAENEIAVTSS